MMSFALRRGVVQTIIFFGWSLARQKLANSFQETLNVVGIRVRVGLLGDVFAMAMQSKDWSVTAGPKGADKFALIVTWNRVSKNKEIELCVLTLFDRIAESQRGNYEVALTLEKHFACAKQRFVVRDGEDVRSLAFLTHGYESPFEALDFFLGLFSPRATSANWR